MGCPGVPNALNQLLGRGAGRPGEGRNRVLEVVEGRPSSFAAVSAGSQKRSSEVRPAQVTAARRREDQPGWSRLALGRVAPLSQTRERFLTVSSRRKDGL